MTERSLTPTITVTIGHHTRIYFAFVTTAPTELDSPATVTLHAATFADIVSFAAEPITLDSRASVTPARLVLVDAMELAWQRATYCGHQHPLLSADPVLVERVRQVTDLPVGVGLGVSTGDQAAEAAGYADAVIVGSAFVRAVLDAPGGAAGAPAAAAGLAAELPPASAAGGEACPVVRR